MILILTELVVSDFHISMVEIMVGKLELEECSPRQILESTPWLRDYSAKKTLEHFIKKIYKKLFKYKIRKKENILMSMGNQKAINGTKEYKNGKIAAQPWKRAILS